MNLTSYNNFKSRYRAMLRSAEDEAFTNLCKNIKAMDWQKLDLSKASVLKREVDVALQKMYDTNPEVSKTKLCSAVQYRIQELENFCASNGDDERIILFEKERLRLRKALQSQPSASRDARSVNTNDRSGSPSSTPMGGKLYNNASNSNTNNPNHPSMAFNSSNTPSVHTTTRTMSSSSHRKPSAGNSTSPTPQSGRSHTGSRVNANSTVMTENRSSMGLSQSIYAWEDNNERPERIPLEICEVVFIPSKQVGFYNREDTDQLPEKHVDVQIVLSAEELTTLAARKKAASARALAAKKGSTGQPPSLHSSTPYVDPRRIHKDLLRPTNPDKWISADGLSTYKRPEKV